jgi:hypothetical protein
VSRSKQPENIIGIAIGIAIGSRILFLAFDADTDSVCACILRDSDNLTLQAEHILDLSP